MKYNRLERQMRFIIEIDKLKQVYRQTYLMDGSRRENSAEHSWHLALMIMILAEYAKEGTIDFFKVIKIVLIHDLVEIDAGDTFCYDEKATKDKKQREEAAANRIFNILPYDQKTAFRSLWDEFEENLTPESQFARVVDRLQPILHNYSTQGKTWQKYDVKSSQVIMRNQRIGDSAPSLWEYAATIIENAVKKGYLSGEDL